MGLAIVDEDFWVEFEGGVGAQPGRAGPDLEAGIGSVERLALFAGEQLGQRLGGGFDGVGGLVQQVAAFGRGPRCPVGLDLAGGSDSGVDVGGAAFTGTTDNLAGGGVEQFSAIGIIDG